jgi:hypothetical protein
MPTRLANTRKLRAGAYLRGGDAEVEVDVRIHARHQLLQDERVGVIASLKGDDPAATRAAAGLIAG